MLLELWEQGASGIIEEADSLRVFFEDEVKFTDDDFLPGFLRSDFRREPAAAAQPFERETWDPILVGERFFIAPARLSTPPPAHRIHLAIDSDIAFGTGRHETTQLCLEALERVFTPEVMPESVVLDVGCGSGILSKAASLLGARAVFSCDIDENAIATARHYLTTPLFLGSADAVAGGAAGLVLANISAAVLDRLARDLKRITRSDELLVISGFIHEKQPQSYRPVATLERGDWLCWICRPCDIELSGASAPGEPLSHKPEWWL